MSAIYLDGFDHYGSGTASSSVMTQGAWADANSNPIGTPSWGAARTGTYALQGVSVGSDENRYVLPAAKSVLFISFGYAIDSLPTVNNRRFLVTFRSGANVPQARLVCESTGVLSLYDSTLTSVIAQTSGPVIVARNWHFIELKYDRTAGTFTLRVDDPTGSDTPVINATGLSLGSTIGQLTFCGSTDDTAAAPFHYLDDLFIRDDSGSVNNGWLGDRRVATLFANADTAVAGWTPSYYKEFGAGIARLSYIMAGSATVQNQSAVLRTVAASALDIGSADFTLESMVRFDALPSAANYSSIFSRWDAANNRRSYRLVLGGSSYNNSCLQFDTSTDGTSGTASTKILYPWVPELNVWYHLALVRVSGELMLFVNGEQLGIPITDSDTYYTGGSEVFSIGNEIQGTTTVVSGSYMAGRLDETRFTNGTGRYNAPFSPPTEAFPRGTDDPEWSEVVLLMGYDSGIIDESSFGRTVTAGGSATAQTPSDGSDLGAYTTVNKASPDDNTFIEAALRSSTGILTMTVQPANNDTVTVGTTDGVTPAVYRWRTVLASAFDVLIDSSAQNSLINLLNAINAGPGAGTKYHAGTTSNYDVNASQLPVGQILVTANVAGSGGNSIASTETGSAATWSGSTLSGGSDIPGPTEFKFQRPPNNTTVISAMQTTFRGLKTDAGTATVQTTFIAPLGAEAAGDAHNLSVSARYYSDMLEEDPDTSGPISPTTIINGKIEINRTA